MPTLSVVIASTRPGRAGLPIGTWFAEFARAHGKFDVRLVDLVAVGLPLLDEPNHPRLGKYTHDHTRAWSATVRASDAFVFVTPEYNYSAPPALLNALDYLFTEWAYKPAGFVSYGGVSGGLRSVQMTRLAVNALNMMPLPAGVAIPFAAKFLADGVFSPDPGLEPSARNMLDELLRWTNALEGLRVPRA